MGPFSGKSRLLRLEGNFENYAVTLAEVKLELAQLKSEFRNLEMEWTNCFEKLKQISGRIAKRQALDGNGATNVHELPVEERPEDNPYGDTDTISAAILHRRNLGKPIA